MYPVNERHFNMDGECQLGVVGVGKFSLRRPQSEQVREEDEEANCRTTI